MDNYGGECISIPANVADIDGIEALVAEITKREKYVDILINNAGTSATGEFESVTDKDWQADFDLKLFAAIRLSRLAIPEMRKNKWGRIINVTNIGAKQPRAKSMPTTVTRAAGLAMTKALSKEFAGDNILVNSICIGLIRAGQHERKAAKAGISVEQLYENHGKDVPLGRVGRAEEVANVVAFFSSEASSYVTGSSVNLDGGMSAVM
jgi:NAD(P)-dependent dehydrogenase (short-subunit alcohol dehydrogenase family)